MEGPQVNVKWKSFQSNILSSFESLWQEEGFVDVTLATDGRCLKAHKVMLSASSPFFKKIFQTNPCQHPVVVLQDVHFSELESILKFVYKGEVNILQENLPLLLRAAETLQIRGLCRHIANELSIEENDDWDTYEDEKQSTKRAVSKSPPSSPRNAKKVKTNNNHKQPASPCVVQNDEATKLTVPVYPVDIIKCEPRTDSPESEMFDDECDNPVEQLNLSNTKIIDSDGEENDLSSHTNESAFDKEPGSKNFPYPPFPCPFCDRAYTKWGFRRRHIKACHTGSQCLPCKWCPKILPSHTEWESHVCVKHSLSRNDARNGLLILEEAEVVLQIPQPTRLDDLMTLIKEQKNDPPSDSPKTADGEKEKENEENQEEVVLYVKVVK